MKKKDHIFMPSSMESGGIHYITNDFGLARRIEGGNMKKEETIRLFRFSWRRRQFMRALLGPIESEVRWKGKPLLLTESLQVKGSLWTTFYGYSPHSFEVAT